MAEEVSAVDVTALLTTWLTGVELARYDELPPYAAVIACVEVENAALVYVAKPEPFIGTVAVGRPIRTGNA